MSTKKNLIAVILCLFGFLVTGCGTMLYNAVKPLGEWARFTSDLKKSYQKDLIRAMQHREKDEFDWGSDQSLNKTIPGYLELEGYRRLHHLTLSSDDKTPAVLGYATSGSWVEYEIDVKKEGYYWIDLEVATLHDNGYAGISIEDDAVYQLIELRSTSGWDKYSEFSTVGLKLTAGKKLVTVHYFDRPYNLKSIFLRPSPYLIRTLREDTPS